MNSEFDSLLPVPIRLYQCGCHVVSFSDHAIHICEHAQWAINYLPTYSSLPYRGAMVGELLGGYFEKKYQLLCGFYFHLLSLCLTYSQVSFSFKKMILSFQLLILAVCMYLDLFYFILLHSFTFLFFFFFFHDQVFFIGKVTGCHVISSRGLWEASWSRS